MRAAGGSATPAIVITAPGDLDAGLIRRIAAGQRIELAPTLLAEVDRQCRAAREVLRSGDPVWIYADSGEVRPARFVTGASPYTSKVIFEGETEPTSVGIRSIGRPG